jgi:hypothetical protein
LGTWANANYLVNHGRKFVMSVTTNTCKELFEFLQKGLKGWDFDWLANSKLGGISWKTKENAKPKLVNWLTNVEGFLSERVEALFFKKKEKPNEIHLVPLIRQVI